jgi:hypothetical protein
LYNERELKMITGLVRDGDPSFQNGSCLDAGLMGIGADVLDKGAMQENSANNGDPVMDRMAGESAYAIADYLGDNHDGLKNMYLYPSTLGELNPSLVQGFGDALAPHQGAMIGDRTDPVPGFGSGTR